ncbi:MAG: gamma-glutamylcyclotransferase family protein [Candidatus Pacearchaeota archaeon]|nr:gamma-glutamylcyclotransferase family protein [Candidatus Pacearchaeota archaeon]
MKYNMIGYGSLMSHTSLIESCKNKRFIPVKIKNFRRIFNIQEINLKSDILNLKKEKKSKCNAVFFKVNEKELAEIKEREDWYNFEEAQVYHFKTNKNLGKAFISIDYSVLIDKKGYNPNKTYFILCREAAYHISKEFGEFWDKTTYTSKGERIDKWIRKYKEYDTIN